MSRMMGDLRGCEAIVSLNASLTHLGSRFKGFLQIYQLQTENDEEETWRDLVRSEYFGSVYSSCVPFSQTMDLIGL